MGFRRATESQPVAGSFYSINVYAIRGITLDADALAISKGSIGDATYSLAVGSKLNSLAQVLLGDDFVDDEVSWANEKKCSQPYAMILVGPTKEHVSNSAYIKEEGENLATLDSFSAAKAEVRELESRVIPQVVTSLKLAHLAPLRTGLALRLLIELSSPKHRRVLCFTISAYKWMRS